MREPTVSLADLIAYADGELTLQRRAEIDERLSADPDLRQQFQSLQSVRQRLVVTLSQTSSAPVPKQRVWARLQQTTERRRCLQGILRTAFCLLALLMTLLAALLPTVQRAGVTWLEQLKFAPSAWIAPPVGGMQGFSDTTLPLCNTDLQFTHIESRTYSRGVRSVTWISLAIHGDNAPTCTHDITIQVDGRKWHNITTMQTAETSTYTQSALPWQSQFTARRHHSFEREVRQMMRGHCTKWDRR